MNSTPSPPLARAGRAFSLVIACASSFLPLTATAQWLNGHRANAVIGQADYISNDNATTASGMGFAAGVAVDPASGKVFVSDFSHSRVLRFSSAAAMSKGAAAEAVFGQPDFTSNIANFTPTQSSFFGPRAVFVDLQGNLWVADTGNHRVLRFDNAATLGNQPNANGVLGQPDFVSNSQATTATGMSEPFDITVGWLGTLWVVDNLNNRVLRFDNAAGKSNGAPADGVLGQPNFVTNNPGIAQNVMNFPQGIALRTIPVGFLQFDTELWVSDTLSNRILRFDNAASKSDGAIADGVLGQPDFVTGTPGIARDKLNFPRGLAIDPGGDLWVADLSNHRVLRFADAGSKPDGAPASQVIGQNTFTAHSSSTSQSGFSSPQNAALDGAGNLFVADWANRRVLRFSPGTPRPDNLVGKSASLSSQRGDGIHNTSAAGQRIKVRKKKRKARVHFTVQNEGPFDDDFRLKATRRNRKMKVKYFDLSKGRANITGQVTAGNYVTVIGHRSSSQFLAKARVTKRGLRKRRTKRRLSLQSTSLANNASDRVLAKVILLPKR